MNSKPQKIIINIKDSKYSDWIICLKNKLKILNSRTIEIDCKSLDLSCKNIIEANAIAIHSDHVSQLQHTLLDPLEFIAIAA